MSIIRRILRLPPPWFRKVRSIRPIMHIERERLYESCVSKLKERGFDIKREELTLKGRIMLKAWQIQVVGLFVKIKEYIPERQMRDFWASLCVVVALSNDSEVKKYNSYLQRYGQSDYLTKGPKKNKGVELLARDLTDYILDRREEDDPPPNDVVNEIRDLIIKRDVTLCKETARFFRDQGGAEDVEKILLKYIQKEKGE